MQQEPNQSFLLNGVRYSFSKSQVVKAVTGKIPRRIDKYRVNVDGVYFPPKQVVECLTGVEPLNFTTMDAQRILKRFGLSSETVAGAIRATSVEGHTRSEQYLEHYLRLNGYSNFEFEPVIAGTGRKPDYRLMVEHKPILLEVKEFQPSGKEFSAFPDVNGIRGGAYDPYAPIRQKVDDAREKFKGVKEQLPCCLVLFNDSKPLVDLNWEIVYGAMLGPIGVSIPFDSQLGEFDHSNAMDSFNGGGKCGPKHNTRLSAVLILEPLLLGERRFRCHMNKLRRDMGGRKLTWNEIFEMERLERDRARGTERDSSLVQWRVVVLENPWACNPLSRGVFRGRFDERYGDLDQSATIQRVFVGEGVMDLEALEQQDPPIRPWLESPRRPTK